MQMYRPIEDRIIEAACNYWNVERSYFENKNVDGILSYRKSIVYYLLKEHTGYSLKLIARMFGFQSHQPVKRLIEILDSSKDVYPEQRRDLANVFDMAEKMNVVNDYAFKVVAEKPRRKNKKAAKLLLQNGQVSLFE